MDSHCLQAQRYMILYVLSREGNYTEASQKIADLAQEMDRIEPRNAYLYDEFAKTFCRLVSRLCKALNSSSSDLITEMKSPETFWNHQFVL